MLHHNPYYLQSVDEVLNVLSTSEDGLSISEILKRQKIYGKNILLELGKKPWLLKLLEQVRDLMIVLLIMSCLLSLYLDDLRTAIVLWLIVIVNIMVGYYQEAKAEKILESLKKLMSYKVKVIREAKEIEIEREELVPWDIVKIEEWDSVPADLRIVKQNHLGSNDFSLTWESNPVKKFAYSLAHEVELWDRNNLVFMGTTIAVGNATGVVIGIWMQTELWKVANLAQQQDDDLSPLQKELNHVSQLLAIGTVTLWSVLFVLALFLQMSLHEAFIFALGIASAMVPQWLPAQINTALTLASSRLAKHNVLLKKLSAAETMGSTSVICTDKTWTLTKNEMTIENILIGRHELKVSGIGYEPLGDLLDKNGSILDKSIVKKMDWFLKAWMYASNAKINPPDVTHQSRYCLWDPTEWAVIALGMKNNLDISYLDKIHPEVLEFSFDSMRKRMSSVRKIWDEYYVFVKGALENILEVSTQVFDWDTILSMTWDDKLYYTERADMFAQQAMRNLAYAYKKIPHFSEALEINEVESELIFLGLVSMIDPPRKEVAEAVLAAKEAHIKIIIITGDYALTAKAIAEKIGLNDKDEEIIIVTWEELRKKSDIQVLEVLNHEAVIFSRVAPEDKLRIVDLIKKNDHIVAVTGDGINDAPALKKADIGVAMGKIWSDVAKESAEIVLLDDNFSTLVYAIKEWRIIFQNLKKTILSCITSNGWELFVVLWSLLFAWIRWWPLAISPLLILCIDLIGEMWPLMALTYDPAQPHIMKEKPRNIHEHIMNRKNIIDLIWSWFLMGSIGYWAFYMKFWWDGIMPVKETIFYASAISLTYVTILMTQFANIMSRRSWKDSVFTSYAWSNPQLLWAFAFSMILVLNIVYNPWINHLIWNGPLGWKDRLLAIGGGVIFLSIREAQKWRSRKKTTEQQLLIS